MSKFQKEIIKAKRLFNIKESNPTLNKRISKVINDFLKRNQDETDKAINDLVEKEIHERCYGIFHILDLLSKEPYCISGFKLSKIFRLCLDGLDERFFFEDTVKNKKDFSYQKYREIVERAKPFIVNYKETKVRIPRDPNDEYNEIYFTLLNDYHIKKGDVLNLLSIVYDREKKAKPPKRTINELKYLKDTFNSIAKNGGKEKGLSKEEIQAELIEIEKTFKDYL